MAAEHRARAPVLVRDADPVEPVSESDHDQDPLDRAERSVGLQVFRQRGSYILFRRLNNDGRGKRRETGNASAGWLSGTDTEGLVE